MVTYSKIIQNVKHILPIDSRLSAIKCKSNQSFGFIDAEDKCVCDDCYSIQNLKGRIRGKDR